MYVYVLGCLVLMQLCSHHLIQTIGPLEGSVEVSTKEQAIAQIVIINGQMHDAALVKNLRGMQRQVR